MPDKTIKPPKEITDEQHKKLAIDLFNSTWGLIELSFRTPEETDAMIHGAHTSRYHWEAFSGHDPCNLSRGEWQISHVYAILKMPDSAIYHGKRCLEICEDNGIGDWDIAFAHEALARAYAAAGDRQGFERHYTMAQVLGENICDLDDKKQLFSDLNSEPWYGMRRH